MISSKTSFAQENQNDATWEETIDFLFINNSILLVETKVPNQRYVLYSVFKEIEFLNHDLKIISMVRNKKYLNATFRISVDLNKLISSELDVDKDSGY